MSTTEGKLLIVYEENPEKMRFYLVRVGTKMGDAIKKINGKLINSVGMTDAEQRVADKLSNWIASEEGKACEVQLPLTNVRITEVVHTGFVM